jgi:hypothetical protein
MTNIDDELKRLEEEKKKLQKQKQRLLEQKRIRKAAQSKLVALVKQSGFDSPKALVEALIEKYDVRLQRETTTLPQRRKHTKVTGDLRDHIKGLLKEQSMNRVSKELRISYAVIAKVANGAYDKLK